MTPLFFCNGNFIDSIPVDDRALHYGDGFFETIAVFNNEPQYLSLHLERIKDSSERLQFTNIDIEYILSQVELLLQKRPQIKAILKILVSRGSSEQRGYRIPKLATNRIILALYPWPEHIEQYAQKGISVYLCKTFLAKQPLLAGIKHLNRLEQVIAASEFNSSQYQEGLMFDSEGYLIEATKSNIFIIDKNKLITPELKYQGVSGIMRGIIINLAKQLKLPIFETKINQQQLETADEVFICNSIIKIWPVISIMQRNYSIGPITKMLSRELS